MPEMQPVTSSSIASVGYEPTEEAVYIEFNSGATYRYLGVEESEFHSLVAASSVGSFFNENFKNVYQFEKV